ncbi:MAG: sigma-70 family RNA polymerase sigma factor [Lacipirellulaceae bacterium]
MPTAKTLPATSRTRSASVIRSATESPRRSKPIDGDATKLAKRVQELLATEMTFIANDEFVGRRESSDERSQLAIDVETGDYDGQNRRAAGLPSHLAGLCATPLLSADEERELFRRLNYCKYRANAVRSRLSRSRPDAEKVAEVEKYLARAERLRNHLIQANTRLVMSIARRFADPRNSFDDLLSHGLASLMHSVEKFDYDRGYRFSTYATCAVRRDLYRMVMGRKRDLQRFSTGASELLDGCAGSEAAEDQLTESAYKQLGATVREMMAKLDDRERTILAARFGLEGMGKRASYSRLGERLGISKERVRQLANRAIDKLRDMAPAYQLEGLLA